jgi:hypothetical protein
MFPASERNLTLLAGAPGGGGLAVGCLFLAQNRRQSSGLTRLLLGAKQTLNRVQSQQIGYKVSASYEFSSFRG